MCAKALKGPSLARSVPKPLKGPSLARSVLKPLKEPSLAHSVLKPFKKATYSRRYTSSLLGVVSPRQDKAGSDTNQ